MRLLSWLALLCGAALAALGGADAAEVPAKVLFGKAAVPSEGKARPIGSYAKGCIAGAVALPIDGPHWQVMRLSRNRNWGHPSLVAFLHRFSADAARDGWNGLLVGDMAQPRGGPMLTGHASHQIGLDADIWFTPMPGHVQTAEEREQRSAVSLLVPGRLAVDAARWTDGYATLLRRAVSYPEVARIFVSAAIKLKLCETAGADRAWLRKIRPWGGHDAHFHVRLDCPAGLAGCDGQEPPPVGDGCGEELAYWFKPRPPPKPPTRPPREIMLADLPAACTGVLADGPGGVAKEAGVPVPKPRPPQN